MATDDKKLSQRVAILGVIVAIVGIVVMLIIWQRPPKKTDFTVAVAPMEGTTQQGGATQTTLHVRGEGGYEHPVSLSATGHPSGVRIAFAPPSGLAAPAYNSTMTVYAGIEVPTGDFPIIITGIGADGKEHKCTYTLRVKAVVTAVAAKPPEIKITTPKIDEEVPIGVTIAGTISDELPKGRYMWVMINPHTSPGQWWPQGGRVEPWSGRWNAPAILGREKEDQGVQFDIAVVVVDEKDDEYFRTYLEEGERSGDYPGKPLPPSVIIVDRITVKRK